MCGGELKPDRQTSALLCCAGAVICGMGAARTPRPADPRRRTPFHLGLEVPSRSCGASGTLHNKAKLALGRREPKTPSQHEAGLPFRARRGQQEGQAPRSAVHTGPDTAQWRGARAGVLGGLVCVGRLVSLFTPWSGACRSCATSRPAGGHMSWGTAHPPPRASPTLRAPQARPRRRLVSLHPSAADARRPPACAGRTGWPRRWRLSPGVDTARYPTHDWRCGCAWLVPTPGPVPSWNGPAAARWIWCGAWTWYSPKLQAMTAGPASSRE